MSCNASPVHDGFVFPGVFAFPIMVCISRVFCIPPGTNTKTAGEGLVA